MTIEIDEPLPIAGEAFGSWLIAQASRTDWVGDLAKAAKGDRSFPRDGTPEVIRAHLSEKQAESDMIEAIDDAERSWLRDSK